MTLNIQVGDRLRDNSPRWRRRRMLTIEALRLDQAGNLVKIACREGPGARRVEISASRVHSDDRLRRSGFVLIRKAAVAPEVLALLGQEIKLLRGGSNRPEDPGCVRSVRARLDRVDGHVVFATLLVDDPLATVSPFRAGESGLWHGLSFIGDLRSPWSLSVRL